MPVVNGKHYSYGPKGMAAAKKAAEKSGHPMKMMKDHPMKMKKGKAPLPKGLGRV